MLIQFNFKNFRSFRDETTIDFSVHNIPHKLSCKPVKIASETIMLVSALYGINSSGKSNIFKAFKYMTDKILNKSDDSFSPFLFDDSSKDESLFEVYISIPKNNNEIIYNYGFYIKNDKIIEEWLDKKEKRSNEFVSVFYRCNISENPDDLSTLIGFNTLEFYEINENISDKIKNDLNDYTLIVTLGNQYGDSICSLISEWFLMNKLLDFDNIVFDVPNINNENIKNNLLLFLNKFDNSIIDIENNFIHHKMIDNNNIAKIELNNESTGLRNIISLYIDIYNALDKGCVLFIDGLSSKIHSILLKYILDIFSDRKINNNYSQLIYTTHDISHQLFKKDEIQFIDKNKYGISSIYQLSEYNEFDDDQEIDFNTLKQFETRKHHALKCQA